MTDDVVSGIKRNKTDDARDWILTASVFPFDRIRSIATRIWRSKLVSSSYNPLVMLISSLL